MRGPRRRRIHGVGRAGVVARRHCMGSDTHLARREDASTSRDEGSPSRHLDIGWLVGCLVRAYPAGERDVEDSSSSLLGRPRSGLRSTPHIMHSTAWSGTGSPQWGQRSSASSLLRLRANSRIGPPSCLTQWSARQARAPMGTAMYSLSLHAAHPTGIAAPRARKAHLAAHEARRALAMHSRGSFARRTQPCPPSRMRGSTHR